MKKECLTPLKTEILIIRKTTINDVYMLLKMDKQEITKMYLGGIKNKTIEESYLLKRR